MPTNDLLITLTVSIDQGSGKPGRHVQTSMTVPQNGITGFAIAPEGKTKIGTTVEVMGDLLDKDRAAL